MEVIRIFAWFRIDERMNNERPIPPFLSILVQSPAFFKAQLNAFYIEGHRVWILGIPRVAKVCAIWFAICFDSHMARIAHISEPFS